ncbi:MAG: hypothetical protein CSYNP_04242 [Syntrophus sp. SKADARSKE-3]|nr:hypothetical protein [Syntrophus sp. SKADARSKE-3]
MYSIVSIFGLFLLFLCDMAWASDHLLYFEAQGVAGYSTEVRRPIYYSQNPDAEMQKPSIGFDYLQRFSGETGDIATFALQGRLALTEDNAPKWLTEILRTGTNTRSSLKSTTPM